MEDIKKWEQRKKELLEDVEDAIVKGKESNKDVYLVMRELLLSSKARVSISEFYKKKERE